MLAELAAANAAFSVIKTAIQNGKEIADAGNAIANFVGAKETLEKKARKKGNGSDLEEFMALEKIREQEEQLKTIMIYCGRPGLWGDWQRFLAKARVARREAEEKAKRRRKMIVEVCIVAFFLILGMAILAAFAVILLNMQGKI